MRYTMLIVYLVAHTKYTQYTYKIYIFVFICIYTRTRKPISHIIHVNFPNLIYIVSVLYESTAGKCMLLENQLIQCTFYSTYIYIF